MPNCSLCGARAKWSENTNSFGKYFLIDINTDMPHDRVCIARAARRKKVQPIKLREGAGFNYLTIEEMYKIKKSIDAKHEKYLQELTKMFISPYEEKPEPPKQEVKKQNELSW